MHRTRNLVVALVVVALAMTAVGTLVLGATPKTRILAINGVPGARADICVNGNEHASGIRYGGVAKLEIGFASSKTIKFARATSGSPCRGALLGKETIDPQAEPLDLTMVVTAKSPQRVVVFENPTGPVPTGISAAAIRNAANLGKVRMLLGERVDGIPIEPDVAASPSASPWTKGDEWIDGVSGLEPGTTAYFRYIAKKYSTGKLLAKTGFKRLKKGKLQHAVLVGTKPRNAMIVHTRTNLPKATPTPGP